MTRTEQYEFLALLVKRMRSAQKDYFHNRTNYALRTAIRLEKVVDDLIVKIAPVDTEDKKKPDLFP